MSKKAGKLLAVALASVSALSMVACGGTGGDTPPVANDASTLELVVWNAGGFKDMFAAMEQAFEAKNPDVNVDFRMTTTSEVKNIHDDPNNTVDLYMSPFQTMLAYKDELEPLDDVLAMEVDGVTVGDKVNAQAVNSMKDENGTLYALPYYNAINGLYYNVTEFTANGYKLPKTTDELVTLSKNIVSDNKTPFIYYSDYWMYLTDAWMAQYAGIEVYNDYWKATWTNADGTKEANSIKVFKDNEVKRAAYSVLYELVAPAKATYRGTLSLTNTYSQSYFLQGKALMLPNGSWMENEMRNTQTNIEVGLMKTPVISALGTKLGLGSDEELSAIVAYVDGDATADQIAYAESVDASIVEAVRTARNVYFSELFQYHSVIPKDAVAKDAAKKFLAFYYSDEALQIMEGFGGLLPAKYSDGAKRKTSTDNLSTFMKRCIECDMTAIYIGKTLGSPLFYNNDVGMLYQYAPASEFYYVDGKATVDKYFEKENSYWTTEWANLLKDAGLN